MSFRKLFLQAFLSIMVILSGIAGWVWYVDPYQHFRADDVYIGNQRLEIPGIARHHDYDAVILGSSMCMNHYPQQVDSLWGWHTRNFTFMGANSNDYVWLMPLVFAQGKARHVIWGLDVFSFTKENQLIEPYLYDENKLNDIAYLLNYTSVKNCIAKLSNPLSVNGLYHFSSPCGAEEVKQSYSKAQKKYFSEDLYDLDVMCQLFDRCIVPLSSNSISDIYVYFPPYSIGEFVMLHEHGYLDTYMRFKQHVVEQLLKLSNVRLYDFQVKGWIDDLDEYMDLRHHSHRYNRQIMECIHNDEYRLTADNYLKQFEAFKKMIEEYDAHELGK